MDKNKITSAFNQYFEKAKQYINDSEGIKNLMDKLDDKMQSIPQVGPVWDNLKSMLSMLGAYARGEYRDVPVRTLAAIIGTLLYVLNPIDVVLDVIPVVGIADDIAIIVIAYNIAKPDVERYNKWLLEQNKVDVEIEFENLDEVKETAEEVKAEELTEEKEETEATEIKYE